MNTAIRSAEKLHDLGQSLWLDNITRDLLTSGTLERYIREMRCPLDLRAANQIIKVKYCEY